MDIPGVFYSQGEAGGGDGTGPPGVSFYNEHEQEMGGGTTEHTMYPTNGQAGPSVDAAAFDNWFLGHGMDYQSADSPEQQQQQQQRAAGAARLSPMETMMDPRAMQGGEGGGPGGLQQLPPHLQHAHPMFGHPQAGGHMPFLNYDSMGLMPAGTLQLPPLPSLPPIPPSLNPSSLPPPASTGPCPLFPPQLFSTCTAQVGPALSISTSSYNPFNQMQLSSFAPHPSTSMSQQQQQQQSMSEEQLMQANRDNPATRAIVAELERPNVMPPVGQQMHHAYTASASDSSSQITNHLMQFRQGGEETEFVRKAIESLVKKLKDKRMELESLINAVVNNGRLQTGCVTIQRSLDGRLQVAGRKGVPHVVYARIWRWPNVSKTELSKLSICRVTSDNQDFICINPYHYERVVSSAGGTMAAPSEPVQQSQSPQQVAAAAPPAAVPFGRNLFSASRGDWITSMAPAAAEGIHNGMLSMATQPPVQQAGGDAVEAPARNVTFSIQGPPPVTIRTQPIDLQRVHIPPAQHYPTHWCTINYFEHDAQVGESYKVRREMMSITVDGGCDPQGERDGRLCIGSIPNVHRQNAVDIVRMHIGAGVVLKQYQDGRVTLTVRSNKAVFVRAPYVDYVMHTPYAKTIHKMQQHDGELTVFDLRWAYYEMCEQTQSAQEACFAQARAVAGLPVSHPGMQQMSSMVAGSGVDEMKRMFCTVGLSFVKGFGGEYNRKSIKDCPCWIEVELHRPLQLLDQLLKRSYI